VCGAHSFPVLTPPPPTHLDGIIVVQDVQIHEPQHDAPRQVQPVLGLEQSRAASGVVLLEHVPVALGAGEGSVGGEGIVDWHLCEGNTRKS